MKNEIINIATLSKGRLKDQAEKVFKKNGLKIISKSERSLIVQLKVYQLYELCTIMQLKLYNPLEKVFMQ